MKQKGFEATGEKHIKSIGQTANSMKTADELIESTLLYSPAIVKPSPTKPRYSMAKSPLDLLSRWQSAQLGHWEITYDVQEKLTNISNQLDELSADIYSIKDELDDCKRSISELHEKLETRPIVKQTNITEIGDGFKVKIPIPVTIEEYDDEVTVSVPEIDLYASGVTEGEAISRLKKEIAELYNELLKTPKDELGYLPLAWLRVMEATIEKNGQTR